MIKNRLFLFLFSQFFILGLGDCIVSPLIPMLAKNYGVGLEVIGSTLSLNTFGILLTSLFSGILLERFGRKNIFTIGSLLFIATFLSLYFSKYFIFFALSYFVFGLSRGIITINSTTIVVDNSISNKSKRVLRLHLGFMSGAFIAPILVSIILRLNSDWKYLFLLVAFINTILLVSILSIKPEGFSTNNKENLRSIFFANRMLLSNKIIILCGIINFFDYGFSAIFIAWFTTYWKNLNITLETGSLILSLYLLMNMFGMLTKSSLVTKLGERKVIQLFPILSLALLGISFFIDLLIIKIILILLFGFSFPGIGGISLAMSVKQNTHYSGSITSIQYSFSYSGIIIFHYIAGYLMGNFSLNSIIYIGLAAVFLLIIFTNILNFYYKSEAKSYS